MAGLFWWVLWDTTHKAKQAASNKSKTQALIRRVAREADDFSIAHEYITSSGRAFIAIDEARMKLRLGGRLPRAISVTSKTFSVDEVLGVQVTENGRAIFGSDIGNVVGMAALGGLAFGGAGAVVGAIAGKSAKKISDVSLVLNIDDLATPFASINFLESEVATGSPEHAAALAEARKWLASVSVLLSRRDRGTGRLPLQYQ